MLSLARHDAPPIRLDFLELERTAPPPPHTLYPPPHSLPPLTHNHIMEPPQQHGARGAPPPINLSEHRGDGPLELPQRLNLAPKRANLKKTIKVRCGQSGVRHMGEMGGWV